MGHSGEVAFQRRSVSSRREADGLASADVEVEAAVGDVQAGPDDLAGLGHATDRAAARGEVHRILAHADGLGVAALEMRGRDGAGDLEDPDELPVVFLAPADVVKRGRRVEAHRGPDAVGDQGVGGDPLVDLVEVRQGLPVPQHPAAVPAGDRRAVDVVEQALGQVARGDEVLKALLVLDPDCVEAEVVADAQGGYVHLALLPDLFLGQLGAVVGAEKEPHPPVLKPAGGPRPPRRRPP